MQREQRFRSELEQQLQKSIEQIDTNVAINVPTKKPSRTVNLMDGSGASMSPSLDKQQ